MVMSHGYLIIIILDGFVNFFTGNANQVALLTSNE